TPAPAPEQADQAREGHGRDAVRGAVDALVHDDGFPAALASVRDERGRTRHLVAGVGDLGTGARVPTDGRVRFASNSKTFVAVAVMQLVGEGKIELDAPIGTYLPGLVDNGRDGAERVDGATITVRQVLQHTSGIPEYLDVLLSDGLSGVDAMIDTYVQPRALLDAAMTRPATFAPGTSWSYSNTNYVIAGLLVEKVTGRPLHEVLTQRVIEKAGLRDTYLPAVGEREIRGRHPHGYHSDTPGGTLRDVTELDPSAAWAAGDVIGTPSDLIRLYTAILDGRLVGPAELAEMQKTVPVPAEWGPMRYGLGIAETSLSCGGVAWGHGGDIFGYSTREGVTTDGRAASVAVTALPSSVSDPEAMQHVDAVIDTALCA
ncbi:serine hydrolase domain-containing protein, partial [Cellulomonas septica]